MKNSIWRVGVLVQRHVMMLGRSWARLIEIVYMPTISIFQWIFLKNYFSSLGMKEVGQVLLLSWLMWELIFRSKQGTVMSLFEDMWSRSLGQIFTTPITHFELLAACYIVGFIRAALGLSLAVVVIIVTNDFNIISSDFTYVFFIMLGLAISGSLSLITSGFVIRWGIRAENLAWAFMATLAPLSGVLNPVTALPAWLQHISYLLPTTYLFECLRSLISHDNVDEGLMVRACGMTLLWLVLGMVIYSAMFKVSRESGNLVKGAE
ncbi:ABC-2 type transporter [Pseudomonas syringae pv. theae ICMP 3923]|uniref:ABC-2 type transporter n=4 Tax=Pseudomonas syringae TaxID=317 RepID=A0A656JJA9_PSESF|nr:ABC-2 type transporter [Pseudomonas syringae pv. actinidiae ICMP 19098]EPM68090.1 ABC-2 type transporter [Pseudomonas syringae pv. actinidiae ICMP 18804]EPM69838.1 ABC-2 type transporter [Pseudomonas syringae pv. theae ICMP 3923]EPN14050.1 ABC-2 type transporter [Pseudomonas syringae pv. actinidiae ICMP 19100]EPN25707.1 ABC-2 type transporter [Pseudomonas syringae pv. actinidiae ICMP 19099]EPN30209.1 ABC-2 type transporter [Pseudomonas syringae pv. actinidiae ICMP 18883]EPN31019.1 ABC-2 ty